MVFYTVHIRHKCVLSLKSLYPSSYLQGDKGYELR